MAIVFFFFGYAGKRKLAEWLESGIAFAPALLIAALVIGLNVTGVWKFRLDMKMKVYAQPLLDCMIPLACVIVVLQLCFWISRWNMLNGLAFLGTVTITIMYLHIPVNILLKYGLGLQYGPLVYTLAGVVIPLGMAWVMSKSAMLTALFLGRQGFGGKTGQMKKAPSQQLGG